MTYNEWTRSYAAFENITITEAKRRLDALQDFIIGTLDSGEDIQVPGFAHMYLEVLPPQTFINPKTGESVPKGERLNLKCDLSKVLKQRYKDADFKVSKGE